MVDNAISDFPIDAVIAWVDGDDETHLNKMKPYLAKTENDWNDTKFQTRFVQVDEIEFAVKSIIKFAPFIKRIFIVTDNQEPDFLKEYRLNKSQDSAEIVIVDHTEIFTDSNLLPVFNCRPIETMFYNIPNISEHFIYFNDDFSLLRKVEPSDFFINGFPVLRGFWKPLDDFLFTRKIQNGFLKLIGKTPKYKKYGYKRGQQNAARELGFEKYLKIDHTPAPMRKSTLENYFLEHPEMRAKNIRHRFRDPEQYVLQSLANHIEIKNKSCIIKHDYQLRYIGGSHKKSVKWYSSILKKTHKDLNILFLCMQSLDLCPPEKRKLLFDWLEKNNK